MAFETTIICQGYTAAGFLALEGGAARRLLLSSYTVSFARNLLQAGGAYDYADSVRTARRIKGAWVADVPSIATSLGFYATPPLMKLLCGMLRTRRNGRLSFRLEDEAAGIAWKFDECYLTRLSFGASEHAVTQFDLELFIPTDKIEYEWTRRRPMHSDRLGLGTGVGSEALYDLVPYWAWEIDILGARRRDILDFKFGFSQEIKPKYECAGKDSPSKAAYLLFGLPEISFSETRALVPKGEIAYPEKGTQFKGGRGKGFFASEDSDLREAAISLGLPETGRLLTLTGGYVTSSAPSLVEAFPTVALDWQFAGGLI